MKKVKIISIAILIFVLSYSLTTYAQGSLSRGNYFGGRIISLKSYEVETYESAGFICDVPGTSIEIKPTGGRQTETSFLISTASEKWTPKYNLRQGQWILGINKGTTRINCKKCEEAEAESGECYETSFELPTVTKYGTSR